MTPYKVLITGAGGMLATAVEYILKPLCPIVVLNKSQLDITKQDEVIKSIENIMPTVIVNAAAYKDADECEENREVAIAINGTAVGYLAQAAYTIGARLIHISSDYVFDGGKNGYYTENDTPHPISVYGQSKLKGEQELVRFTDNYIIIRTQWMFGENGRNFVDTIIKFAQDKDELKVVDDQYGSPTYTRDIAEIIRWFVENNHVKGQIFNFSNEGIVSRFAFAQEILKRAGIKKTLIPVDTPAYPRPAQRPHNSALDKSKIKEVTHLKIRPWQDALNEYMKKQW